MPFHFHHHVSFQLHHSVIEFGRVEASSCRNNLQLCHQASPRPCPPQRHPHRAPASHPDPKAPQSYLSKSVGAVRYSLADSPTCCSAWEPSALSPTARNSVSTRNHRTTSTVVLAICRRGRWVPGEESPSVASQNRRSKSLVYSSHHCHYFQAVSSLLADAEVTNLKLLYRCSVN